MWSAFQAFASHPDAEFWQVLAVQDRELCMQIARETGIVHESPQAILFYRGRPAWHASHWSITEKAMAEALDGALQA